MNADRLRWQQFQLFLAGHAAMPETGFAKALYYQVAGDAEAGREAIAWALGPATDLRQQALVYDWCQDLLSEAQNRDLAARMQSGMADTASDDAIAAVRARVMAAVALFDRRAADPRQELERVVRGWWSGKWRPRWPPARSLVAREDAYALYELLHVLRDNTNRGPARVRPPFFRELPHRTSGELLPGPFEAPENAYYIGAAPPARASPTCARRRFPARRNWPWWRYDPNAAGHTTAAGLADARPLPAARRFRRAL